MTAPLLTVNITNASVLEQLSTLARKMGDLTPAMQEIGADLDAAIHKRFLAQADPNGAQWAPLSPATLANRAKTGTVGGILQQYGTMLASLSYEAGASSVRVGFTQPYAMYHETGTKATPKRAAMPRRGILLGDPVANTLGAADQAMVLDVISSYLAKF